MNTGDDLSEFWVGGDRRLRRVLALAPVVLSDLQSESRREQKDGTGTTLTEELEIFESVGESIAFVLNLLERIEIEFHSRPEIK